MSLPGSHEQQRENDINFAIALHEFHIYLGITEQKRLDDLKAAMAAQIGRKNVPLFHDDIRTLLPIVEDKSKNDGDGYTADPIRHFMAACEEAVGNVRNSMKRAFANAAGGNVSQQNAINRAVDNITLHSVVSTMQNLQRSDSAANDNVASNVNISHGPAHVMQARAAYQADRKQSHLCVYAFAVELERNLQSFSSRIGSVACESVRNICATSESLVSDIQRNASGLARLIGGFPASVSSHLGDLIGTTMYGPSLKNGPDYYSSSNKASAEDDDERYGKK
ncbi:MAG: hypothetical protein A3F12_00100 [Gammaproteobacteria bacterium RIFCSPHIGHO2_12_FULL_38_14]|nr:MAG: hypothetical protein A3F12_00100 [Gammaproteobacteria bacterium RIFCSPHIGHO2_12_FULL_38_14]